MTDAPAQPRWIDYMPLEAIEPALRNAKRHDLEGLAQSYERFGFVESPTMDERTGRLVAGHGRLASLLIRKGDGAEPPEGVTIDAGGRWLVPVERGWASADDEDARAYLVGSNRLTEAGGWDRRELAEELVALDAGGGLAGTGYDGDELALLLASLEDAETGGEGGGEGGGEPKGPSLADRFLVPPFSTLDARAGYWQDRKRAWLSLGIRSEEGREANLLNMSEQALRGYGDAYKGGNAWANTGTSIFDPVLCEIAYRWFTPPDGRVLDPFAGGSVRGVVAAWLGRSYIGVELRAEQVASNQEQGATILEGRPGRAHWTQGDSADVLADEAWEPEPCDLVFSCPPYFDLEVYSQEPGDLSAAESYDDFLLGYRKIIRQACARLRDDSFAVWVVGDVRAPDGSIRGLIPDTIEAFRDAGLRFYNEGVLITPVGSLALRAARIFAPARKLGRSHQSFLVFVKGDARKAAERCGPVEVADPAELFGLPLLPEGEPDAVADELPDPTDEELAQLAQETATAPQLAQDGPGPAWAKGRSVERLGAATALWAAHDGNLPLSVFTKTREADLATAAEKGELVLLEGGGSEVRKGPHAGFIGRKAKAKARVLDFRGHEVGTIARGDFVVSKLAALPGYEGSLVQAIRGAAEGARIWLTCWQEHPADRAIARALGLAWQGTKVRASSELIGIYAPLEEATLPFADSVGLCRLDLGFDAAALAAEVAVAEVGWADHYASYNVGHSWSAVALRSYGGDPGFIIKPAEMAKGWKAEHPDELGWELATTPLAEQLPGCWSLACSLGEERLHRVRLMRLAPGDGELTRHADITDPDAGTEPGQLLRLHFPIETNPQVTFRQWLPSGAEVAAHMAAGEGWSLDTRLPHTARNGGTTERVHLVVDVESHPDLLARFADAPEGVLPSEAELPEPQATTLWSL